MRESHSVRRQIACFGNRTNQIHQPPQRAELLCPLVTYTQMLKVMQRNAQRDRYSSLITGCWRLQNVRRADEMTTINRVICVGFVRRAITAVHLHTLIQVAYKIAHISREKVWRMLGRTRREERNAPMSPLRPSGTSFESESERL